MAQTSVEAFLRKNVSDVELTEKVKFKRFSEPFVIKSISETESSAIRKACTKKRPNKAGQVIAQTDTDLFTAKLITAAVVSPDPNSAALQESWGTPGRPEETLKAMLLTGEYAELGERVQTLCGFETDTVEDLSEEVKK